MVASLRAKPIKAAFLSVIAVILLFLFGSIAFCKDTKEKPSKIKEQKQLTNLEKIKNFLKKVPTLTTKFVQEDFTGNDSVIVSGNLFLDKSNGLRIDYDEFIYPTIIADKEKLVLLNRHDNTMDTYSLGDTPAFFILKQNLDFNKDMEVVLYAEKQDEAFLTLKNLHGYSGTLITFYFAIKPFILLKGWMVENDGKKTMVNFIKDSIKIGEPLNKNLFAIPNNH